jgi:hypothetical protein
MIKTEDFWKEGDKGLAQATVQGENVNTKLRGGFRGVHPHIDSKVPFFSWI